MRKPSMTILVPTWRAHATVASALRSALRQTVREIEVLVVGDGVNDRTRQAVLAIASTDPRVRFLDLPKGEHRGEANRHLGVLEARAPAIAYLADDDLLLPRHVENLLGMLEDAQLVQSANAYIAADDRLVLWPTDLADPRWVRWHLTDPPRNRVSITGTAHRRDVYLELEDGWAHDPSMRWSDLPLWRQFFSRPDFAGRTHAEVTTLQFPAAARRALPEHTAIAQFERWELFTQRPDAHEELQQMARDAAARQLIELSAASTNSALELESARETERRLRASLDATVGSISWRITAPLRAVRRVGRSRRSAEHQ